MKLHLGCGTHALDGWVNLDLDAPAADVHADLRQALPFPDATADWIFCEHVIEHITREEGLRLLVECRRVLTLSGVLRLSTPDLRWLIAQYIADNLDEWRDVTWTPQTSCQLMNEGMRSWGHQFLYDRDELTALLHQAGFTAIRTMPHRQSEHLALTGLECRPWHRELILEAGHAIESSG